ncbi:MAG: hypothetical protein JWQ74_3735 [Marmoricola sp.]|nr:hypothetical protein [Marmoricola sp.]
MTQPPPYEQTHGRPLVTDDDIEERVAAIVGRAQQREIWLLFLDGDGMQLPVLAPFGEPPIVPDKSDLPAWSGVIGEIVEATGARSVIAVIERYGSQFLTHPDRLWARLVANACGEAVVPLRAIVVSHRRGVCVIPPDDYVG